MQKKLSIKDLAIEDRPREKLMSAGRTALTDSELIAILISSGNSKETAVQLSQRILNSCSNDLNLLASLNVNDLCKFKGIGEAKAISIVAAMELGRRRKERHQKEQSEVTTSQDAFRELYPVLSDLPHEEFFVLFLNRSNKMIKKVRVSSGGISGTVVDQRLIFKQALELHSSSLILSHNHPSGNLKPSQEDINITRKIKEAGKLLELQLLDHLIIAGNRYYSFADEGIL
jgi:DNA repair protein RadC